jgi:transcriptional repressor NrdR
VRCPYCSDEANRVIDSRLGRDGAEIRRRRECLECGRRFTTRERVEEILPKICKRDERREDYERQKLVLGIQKACEKRAVSAEAIERLADRVERHLQELGEKEVASARIGERVMEELKRLDPVAAARFASVFRNFQGARDYARFFAELEGEGGGRAEG